jgi:type IV secretory pathway TrbL component
LQASANGAFGHGVAAAGDYVPLAEGGSGGIASNSQGESRATYAHSPGRPAGKVSRKRPGAGDNRAGVAAGTQAGCKPVAEDDIGQAERLADNNGNGDYSSIGSGSECNRVILSGTTREVESPPKNHHI